MIQVLQIQALVKGSPCFHAEKRTKFLSVS